MSDICERCSWRDMTGCGFPGPEKVKVETGGYGTIFYCNKFTKESPPTNHKEKPVNTPPLITDAPASKESADPNHYKHGTWEVIKIIEDVLKEAKHTDPFISYCHGQVIRYILRLGRKDQAKVEAEKAMVYLKWMLERMG